ncbi:MAG: glycosyltransferase [Eubacterium sp.]|nr:glycosyltransferase [Eubacterium sp.]
MEKISVIIPAYNVEAYIRRCLDSVLENSYPNLEVIVIDDGSEDRTAEFIEEYVEMYPDKIRFVKQANKGLAATRNVGMKLATGDYIAFVDSDDFVEKTMYEKLIKEAKEKDCDLVTCGFYQCYEDTGEIVAYQSGFKGEFDQSIFDNPHLLRINSPHAVNKLYRRDLVEKADFSFPEGMIFEDLCSVFPLFAKAEKVGRVHEPLYYYIRNRANGILATYNEKHGQIVDSLGILVEKFKEMGYFDQFEDTLRYFSIRHIYARFDDMDKYNSDEFRADFEKRAFGFLDQWFPGWRDSQEFAELRNPEEDAEDEEDTASDSESENVEKEAPKAPKNKKKRSEIFEEYVLNQEIKPNSYLIECFHGHDFCGQGYNIAVGLAEKPGNKVFVSAANDAKLARFKEKYSDKIYENIEFINVTRDEYLEALATCEYVFNNVGFHAFYRKRDGQKFIFTDFLPGSKAGLADRLHISDMQARQMSMALADAIPYPAEVKDSFERKLQMFCMDKLCRKKGLFVPFETLYPRVCQDLDMSKNNIKYVYYCPKNIAYDGVKDKKYYLFLSRLKKRLNELDELIGDDTKVVVEFPRLVRRRFKNNEWKHIIFANDKYQGVYVSSQYDAIITECEAEADLLQNLGKRVLFSEELTPEVMAEWIGKNAGSCVDGDGKVVDVFASMKIKAKKNPRIRHDIVYVDAYEHKKDLDEFMSGYNLKKTIFMIEKSKLNESMSAWLSRYYGEIMLLVIIRNTVISSEEEELLEKKKVTKGQIRRSRDRERYLGYKSLKGC